ncbi:hypothetical protein M8998_03520 [Sphingobacterium sp. lm-10]|uniref:hypothetical protein n=1 Tax=Sphingobacterium sp. lm-10 TaxID=2944904 RepID=UPI0020213096|nr:hypothetical protein [Sphingobacterium sp. lm-10]MCL7987007.1 hypothetical protein [Sphingobacterium sp. lm-10]
MYKNQTVLDKAIGRALSFVHDQKGEELANSACVRVGIYVHRRQPPLPPLGINYIITFKRGDDGEWLYDSHERHIPSVDYAKITNVDPILHYCG